MKRFKILMVATSEKEVFLDANSEEEALNKLENMYFDEEEINFTDEDIVSIKNICEEIKTNRRSKLEISPIVSETVTEDEENIGNEDISKEVFNVFQKVKKDAIELAEMLNNYKQEL